RWIPPEQTLTFLRPIVDRGFTLIAVRHGSSPRYNIPDAVADVRRAVRHVRGHAAEIGVDAERLGVTGMSAGRHPSLMLGTTADSGDPAAIDPALRPSDRVRAVVAFFPPVDLRDSNRLIMANPSGTGVLERFRAAFTFDTKLAPEVSPLLHVSPDD